VYGGEDDGDQRYDHEHDVEQAHDHFRWIGVELEHGHGTDKQQGCIEQHEPGS
jgi:hypothetical protein